MNEMENSAPLPRRSGSNADVTRTVYCFDWRMPIRNVFAATVAANNLPAIASSVVSGLLASE
jgi:hypothetical protein